MNTDSKLRILQIAFACLCMGGFLLVLALVVTGRAAGFDDPIREMFYAMRSEGLTGVLVIITNTANKFVIIAICLILLAIPQMRRPFGVPLSAGALAVILLNSLIKHLVCRPRPEILHLVEEDGFSFTSGHSIMSMFFYGLALWLVWHHYGRLYNNKTIAIVLTIVFVFLMFAVGLTRIYLGVHFPSDVLGAWCLAGFAIFIEAEIILALERRNAPSPGDVPATDRH